MPWRVSWPAEGLLLSDPAVITSERWGHGNSYHFWAYATPVQSSFPHFKSSQRSCEMSWHPSGLALILALLSAMIGFMNRETEVQRGEVTSPKSHSQSTAGCLTPMLVSPKLSWYGFSLDLGERGWSLFCDIGNLIDLSVSYEEVEHSVITFPSTGPQIHLGARCLWQLRSLRIVHGNRSHIKTKLYVCSDVRMPQLTGRWGHWFLTFREKRKEKK